MLPVFLDAEPFPMAAGAAVRLALSTREGRRTATQGKSESTSLGLTHLQGFEGTSLTNRTPPTVSETQALGLTTLL